MDVIVKTLKKIKSTYAFKQELALILPNIQIILVNFDFRLCF